MTKHPLYSVHSYTSPNEVTLMRGQYKSSMHLLLKKHTADTAILDFDCGAIITDAFIGRLSCLKGQIYKNRV